MLKQLWQWLYVFLSPRPVRLAIVRRYADANGNYVGELYLEGEYRNAVAYNMIGVSLDSLPLEIIRPLKASHYLDTRNDFLAYMPSHTVRVGALDPADNDEVRRLIAGLPRRNMMLTIRNGFIEHILDRKGV